MVPPRPPPPNYMAIGDEGSPMMHDERRTVDLMHKPNGEPNVYNATPRIIKKEPRVSKAEPTASAAKAPAPSVEPVEFDPASSLKAQMRPYDASGDAGLSPHAEYSLEILREFFKKRPIQSLKDTFYSMDANCSGKLDEQEFKEALKHLHIDVTAKDSAAIFRAVDFDKSGELNFDEFYRSFRTDAFKRADFFWGKARPFAAPDRANRAQLAHELGVKVDKASTAEIMATIQAKVDRKGIQLMYRVFDEKRDGLRNTKAFAKSMKRVGIELTDAEADDVIRAIHLQAGTPIPLGSHVSFDAFAKAFKPDGYSLLADGVPSAQNYMNHSRPSSADNARVGGAQVFAASRADEAAFPVEARSTTDEMRRVVCRHPAPPPGKPRAVPRLSLAGAGAEKEARPGPGLASATWAVLPQPLQTGGELLPPSSARDLPEIASSARDRPEIAISLPTSPVTVSSSLSPPRPPSQAVSPQHPSPPEGSPVSGLSVSPRRRGNHGLTLTPTLTLTLTLTLNLTLTPNP